MYPVRDPDHVIDRFDQDDQDIDAPPRWLGFALLATLVAGFVLLVVIFRSAS